MDDHGTNATEKGRWYPAPPPRLPGDGDGDGYTNRLTGADMKNNRPYDHSRNRQCSIGWHSECTDPAGRSCECPCHKDVDVPDVLLSPIARAAADLVAEMYDVPGKTGRRVMAATVSFVTPDAEISDPDALRAVLAGAYGSQVTTWFVTDIGMAVARVVRVRNELLLATGADPDAREITAAIAAGAGKDPS